MHKKLTSSKYEGTYFLMLLVVGLFLLTLPLLQTARAQTATSTASTTPVVVEATPNQTESDLGSPEEETASITEDVPDSSDTEEFREEITEPIPPVVSELVLSEVEVVEPAPQAVEDDSSTEGIVASATTIVESSVVEESTNEPELTTDKPDYHLYETATIFGKFFSSLQNISLKIFGGTEEEGTYTETTSQIQTDNIGEFIHKYQLDLIYRPLYTVIASTLGGEELARTTFTDAPPKVDLEQCRNGTAASPSNCVAAGGSSGWVTGNVGASQGHLAEGLSIPYRAAMTDLPVNVPITITFGYDIKHSDKHAIDYLTHYDRLEPHALFGGHPAETITPTSGVSGITGPTKTFPIPPPSSTGSPVPGQPTTSFNNLPANERVMTIFGGMITGMSYIVPQGDLTVSNSETRISVTFMASSSNAVLSWGGHIASRVDWGEVAGVPRSAGGISGSPYHMRTIDWNLGNLGNQDRSLSAGTVAAPSTITIRKVTVPGGSQQSFTFNVTGNGYVGPFNLSDGGSNTQNVNPGSYTVTEAAVAGWSTNINCTTVSGTGTSATPNQGARSIAITIGASGGAVVDCTYTNTLQQGNLKIIKNTVGGDATFDYSVTGPTPLSPSIITAGGTGMSGPTPVNAGTNYAITETVPAGWQYDSATCDKDFTAGANGVTGVTVVAGQTTTCTFTNTKLGTIIVEKQTLPDGSPVSFNFTGDVSGNITDGNQITVNNLAPGQYTSTETAKAGWDLTSVSCNDGNSTGNTGTRTATFNLEAGETVKCTFENTQRGNIVVDKVTVPGADPQQFSFDAQGGVYADFSLTDQQAPNDQGLVPGNYSVTENEPTGWNLTGLTCNDPTGNSSTDLNNRVANLTLDPGETINCTFTNTKMGSITVEKQTLPDGSSQSFDFSGDINTSLTDGNSTTVDVVPGQYGVTETVPSGWDLTDITCSDGNSNGDLGTKTATFNVEAGEDVTCVFTNTERGSITIKKQTLPNGSQQTFDFTGDVNGSLADDGTATVEVAPGQYSSTETVPADWDLTDITCDDNDSGGNLGTKTATFNVEPGEDVICTFTNTQRAHIIIEKNAIPDSSQEFTFNNDFGNGNPTIFSLTDDSTPGLPNYDAEVLPGTYAVSEDPVDGWKSPKSVTCSNLDDPSAITVGPGETVTCTFVNQKLATITLVKNTVGGDDTFDFVMTGVTLDPSAQLTTIAGTDQETFTDIDPDNTYTITETPLPAGWVNISATCDNGDPVNNITPNSGENIICTFENRLPGAKIELDPLVAYNEVGDDHIVTATVMVHEGDGVYFDAPDGTTVTFSLDNNNNGAVFVGGNTCNTVAGECSVTINATQTGSVDIHAEASPLVLGLNIDVATGTGGDNSADAVKTYVDAKIAISPQEATNAISDDHLLTVTVMEDDGSGFVAASGETVTFTVTSGSATFVGGIDTCVTDGAGQCSVSIESNTTGSNTIKAEVDALVQGVIIHRETDGLNNNSGPANKDYVNARILIVADDTNEVDDPHTFTVTVEADTGSGFGGVSGVNPTVSFNPVPGTVQNDTCAGAGTDGSGECTVDINSTVAGVFEASASVSVDIDGVIFNLSTDGQAPNSDVAIKTYVDASIALSPQGATNNVGEEHEITATVTKDDGTGPVPAPGVTVNFSITSGTASFTGGSSCNTDGAGQCSVSIVDNAPSNNTIDASATILVGGLNLVRATDGDFGPDGTDAAEKEYVGAKIVVKKVTVGGDDNFDFIASYDNDGFTLADGEMDTSVYLPLTSGYSVSETVPAGWDLTSATCDNGDDPSNIMLDQNEEVVTCTFENTKLGKITIVKDADPNDSTDFEFFGTNGIGNFTLDDDEGVVEAPNPDQFENSQMFTDLDVNESYTITETIPNEFWIHQGVVCVLDADQSIFPSVSVLNGVTVDIGAGQEVTCTFTNEKLSPTRTQGFWQTHYSYTNQILNGVPDFFIGFSGDASNVTHKGTLITDGSSSRLAKLFGAFWSNIAKTSTGKGKNAQRGAVEKARMQLLQQLVAAKLNCAAFGCTASVQTMITNADNAYMGTNVSAILTAAGEMDAYNNSGDTLIIGNAGKADPKQAKAVADYLFWDTP